LILGTVLNFVQKTKNLVETGKLYPALHIKTNALFSAVAQWLRYCATSQKAAGSIPDGVIGFFR
jgi:hypothetical protein